jgi:hypothetical protein
MNIQSIFIATEISLVGLDSGGGTGISRSTALQLSRGATAQIRHHTPTPSGGDQP